MEPLALVALLARIGTSDPVEPVAAPEELLHAFNFQRFGRAPARFDMEELKALNTRILHRLHYQDVADRLPEGMDAVAWQAIRPNIATRSEEHTSELQSLMRISYAVFCLKKKK